MPRFPEQLSTRTPSFTRTPQQTRIEGAPGLRAVGEAVAAVGPGIAAGVGRAVERKKREDRNAASGALAKARLASKMARRDLNQQLTEGGQAGEVQAAYDDRMAQINEEYFDGLNEDQLEFIQEDRDLLNMEYGDAAIQHQVGLQIEAKKETADVLFQTAMLDLEDDPSSVESVIYELERATEKEAGEDQMVGKVLQQSFEEHKKPALVQVSVERMIESNDIDSMRYMQDRLKDGAMNLDPEDNAKLISRLQRGIDRFESKKGNLMEAKVNDAITRAQTGDEPVWVPDALLEEQPALMAKQNFAKEMFYYGEDLSNDSSAEVLVKQQLINQDINSLIDQRGDVSNEDYIKELNRLQAKQMAIDKHLEAVRESPLSVAFERDPALAQVQQDAIAANTPESWQKYFSLAEEELDQVTAGVRNEDGSLVKNQYLGDTVSAAWAQNIISLQSIPEQQAMIDQLMSNMPDNRLAAVKEEIIAAQPSARDAFVLYGATPGLIQAYAAGRTLQGDGNKRFEDARKANATTILGVQKELASEYGAAKTINTSSPDYTEKERIAEMIVTASLTDPKAQDNLEAGWFGSDDVAGTYRTVFKSLMGDTDINGYIYVPRGVKREFPALALQPEYGQPLPADIDMTEAMIEWIKRDGGSMEITGLAPDETWEDALYKDSYVPTLIPRYDGALGGFVFEIEGSNFRINRNGKPLTLTPAEYASMRATAKTREGVFDEGDVRRQIVSERNAEYRTIDNFIEYFGGEAVTRDPNAARIPKSGLPFIGTPLKPVRKWIQSNIFGDEDD